MARREGIKHDACRAERMAWNVHRPEMQVYEESSEWLRTLEKI